MTRILITGGPRTGKSVYASVLAERMGLDPLAVMRTDDLCGVLEWSEASAEVATWWSSTGPWICEGVAIPRSLRKWIAANPAGAPCDVLYLLNQPWHELTKGQLTMTKGLHTVMAEIAGELRLRGVRIVEGPPPRM